jgi:hypothetical protein
MTPLEILVVLAALAVGLVGGWFLPPHGRSGQPKLPHGTRRILDEEHVDRVIVSATSNARKGLSSDDLEWLLEQVPAEVVILRPDREDHRKVTAEAVAGHF